MSQTNQKLSTTSNKAFVRGIGSAIPGIGDTRLHNGNGGALVHIADFCGILLDDYGVHNPKTGKKIDRDWARRNLGVETMSVGNVGGIRNIEDKLVDTKLTQEMRSISENDLAYVAFDEALERANLKACDIDVILRVSPTLSDVYFWAGLREWKEKYPELKDDVQLQLHNLGCPAFLIELKLAQTLLCSPNVNNVAIVISSCGSMTMDKDFVDMHAADNDMSKWANLCLFGDGASACIVSTDTMNLPSMVLDLVDVQYKTDYGNWISSREDKPLPQKGPGQAATRVTRSSLKTKPSETKPVFLLNVEGPKHIKASIDHWSKELKKSYGFTLSKADHAALHSPNPKVLKMVAKHYGVANKISYLPERVGNLGPASCVTNLHDRLYGKEAAAAPLLDGHTIFGFALGDGIGLTDGVFLLQARATTTTQAQTDLGAESTNPGLSRSNKTKRGSPLSVVKGIQRRLAKIF